MTQEELREILDKHSKWLNDEDGGERADLVDADLYDVNFVGANLRWADLRGANLRWADLRGANLSDADLSDAILNGSNLSGANLRGAQLSGADLRNVVYTDTILNLQCPEEGSFIAWKKLAFGKVAKLIIPWDAKRSSATTRKCRASKAIVMAIYDRNGKEVNEGKSYHGYGLTYRVGETVYSDKWDEDRWNECSNGIHFFITRREAEEY